MKVEIGKRKATVLHAVVRDYIRTAQPVGSGTIVRRYRLGVSPATVRNEMAALEEMGYLAQPHTSAGRIPTDLGYRFYVDTLPSDIILPPPHRRAISDFFGAPPDDVDALLYGTASFLSRLTGYAALVLSPQTAQSRILRAELVPLGSAVLLLVVSDTGRVDKRVLEIGDGLSEATVRRASDRLVRALEGLSYGGAAEAAAALAREATDEERALLLEVSAALARLRDDPEAEHVFVGGVANIADERAFERRDTLQQLVEALEERRTALALLRRVPGEEVRDVRVRIGHENPLRAMSEASVVVSWYRAAGRPAGSVAIVGPTRMQYARVIATARLVARRLSDLVGGLAG